MIRKRLVLVGILLAVFLLLIATLNYLGGSQHDPNTIGFDWQQNYLSNLFEAQAINEAVNSARPWAIAGMFFMCISLGGFFINFSEKIRSKSGAFVIKYGGLGAMICAFLTVTPFHDVMVTLSSILVLLSSFYIVVFVLKSKRHFLKILSVICLLVFYGCTYIYFSRTYLDLLPLMQKITLALYLIWIVSLEYFTQKEDFEQIK